MNDVDIKGIGELTDEGMTLCFRFLVNGDKKSFKRVKKILSKMLERNGATQGFWTLYLALANSLCWYAQEQVMTDNSVRWARTAQKANKFRNKIMGKLNKGRGIITSKTY